MGAYDKKLSIKMNNLKKLTLSDSLSELKSIQVLYVLYTLWKFIAFYVYVHDITNRCFVATTLMTMTTDDGVGEVACAPV